jgi:hypothetical protein
VRAVFTILIFGITVAVCSLTLPCYAELASSSSAFDEIHSYENRHPTGLFSSIVTAHGQEMIMGQYRSFEIIPVTPSTIFTADVPEIFVVFHTHQHDSEFRVSGRWSVEHGDEVPANFVLGTDSMILMTEDESGYVSIKRPDKGWPIGQYKVQMFTGTGDYDMSPIGTLRFSVVPAKAAS